MRGAAPLVGITVYGPDGEPPAVSLPVAYVEAVRMAGGLPVLLAPGSGAADELVRALDAVVLAGGGDLDPEVWGGNRHPAVYGVVKQRDAFELALAQAALERAELPLLAICRGMQLLNVALGGDLEVHIPDVRGETVRHRLPPREPTTHAVRVEADGLLARIYERLEFPVCSWHHQEVRTLGRGLRPCAWAEDGVVEALVLPERRWVVAVQWHPEMQVRDDPVQRRLFAALVEAARS